MKMTIMQDGNVMFEEAKLLFRNFTGKETDYNQAGSRNFCVLLDAEAADMLSGMGWNVRTTKDRDGDDGEVLPGEPYLPVAVGYKGRPPAIVQITSRGRTNLGEDVVETLDWVEIVTSDLIVRPYNWHLKTGATGIKAYLQSLFITINENPLEAKYGDVKPMGHAGVDV